MGIDWFVGFRLIISSLRFLTVTEQQEVVCVFDCVLIYLKPGLTIVTLEQFAQ